MRCRRHIVQLALASALLSSIASAAEPDARQTPPVLRLSPGGPTSFVTALAFGPRAETLYAAGWDKVVRLWRREPQGQAFLLDQGSTIRIPIGPGQYGAINALDVSPDGRWLAVGGKGLIRGAAGFREAGRVVATAAMTDAMRLDEGTIYLLDTETRELHTIRKHMGPVLAITMEATGSGDLLIASAAQEAGDGNYVDTVRLFRWSPDEQTVAYLGGVSLGESRQSRPQLAIRHGAQSAPLVAIAWGDGTLRTWGPSTRRIYAVDDGRQNNSVALLPGSDAVVTASLEGGRGRLSRWRLQPGGAARRDGTPLTEFAPPGGNLLLPRAVSLVSAQADRRADWAAVALLELERQGAQAVPRSVQLQLVALQGKRTSPAVTLWNSGGRVHLPVLATSLQGGFVAAAGNGKHEIHVFTVADLLAGRHRPQVLRSAAVDLHRVWFAENENRKGLLIERQPEAGEAAGADIAFDTTGRNIVQVGGWKVAEADAQGWQARAGSGDRRIDVFNRQQRVSRIVLPPGERATATAVLPRPAAVDVPIVAVASTELGQPMLRLYDAQQGVPLRQLSGHTEMIHHLQFSRDRTLLLSVGQDKTVRVWSLSDLNKIVGRHGGLTGVTLRGEDGNLVVQDIEARSPHSGDLASGDRLLGHEVDGVFAQWNSLRDLYDSFWTSKPGKTIRARVARGGATRDIDLVVDQGTDERKPTFSLLLIRRAEGEQPDWIGWNPIGYFEASDRDAERMVGWHFNPVQPAGAASFAHIDQMRGKYYWQGMLDDLLRGKQPPDPDEAAEPLPRPTMNLRLRGIDLQRGDRQGRALVQTNRIEADLLLTPEPPEEMLERIELRLDGEPSARFQLAEDGLTRQATIDTAAWKRGSHRIEAVVRTNEPAPQEFVESVPVLFQPPAPRVSKAPPQDAITKEADYRFTATVLPGAADEPYDVFLRRAGEQEPLAVWRGQQGQLQIEQSLHLTEGANALALVARNSQALEGYEDLETTRLTRNIHFDPGEPPQIAVKQLLTPAGKSLDFQAGAPVVVETNELVIVGEIQSPQPLARAQLASGDQTRTLAGFEPGGRSLQFRHRVELQPGRQELALRAESDNQQQMVKSLAVDFRPPLPTGVQFESPVDRGTVFLAAADMAASATVPWKARLKLPEPFYPFQLQVRSGDEAEPRATVAFESRNPDRVQISATRENERPTINLLTGEIEGQLRLERGHNTIQLVFSNRWRPQGEVHSVAFDLLLKRTIEVERTKANLADVYIQGGSAEDLEFQWRGRRLKATPLPDRPGVVKLSDVPLGGELVVHARGENRTAREVLRHELPRPDSTAQLPEITIENPADEITLDRDYRLQFTVPSEPQATQVEVIANGVPVQPQPGEKPGQFTADLTLQDNVNQIAVHAYGSGGANMKLHKVHLRQRPAQIRIESPLLTRSTQQVASVSGLSNRIVHVAPRAPHSKLEIRGHVQFSDVRDRRLRSDSLRLRLRVNGFQYPPVPLQPAAANRSTRAFRAEVYLNRAFGNQVEIWSASFEHDAGSREEFFIDCEHPAPNRSLHLLVIGVGSGSAPQEIDVLEKQALRVFQARRQPEKGTLQSQAFEEVFVYGPLVGESIQKKYVLPQMQNIVDDIRALRATSGSGDKAEIPPGNHVIVFYYQGGEIVFDSGRFALTLGDVDPARLAGRHYRQSRLLGSDELQMFIDNSPGAHLMLLDVSRRVSENIARNSAWPENSQAAVLRYAWLKPTEKVPQDARLIVDMQDALAEQNSLRGVDQVLADRFTPDRISKSYPGALLFESFIPATLGDLTLTAPGDD